MFSISDKTRKNDKERNYAISVAVCAEVLNDSHQGNPVSTDELSKPVFWAQSRDPQRSEAPKTPHFKGVGLGGVRSLFRHLCSGAHQYYTLMMPVTLSNVPWNCDH